MFLEFVMSLLGDVPDQYLFVPVIAASILLVVFSAILVNFFIGIFYMFFYKT